MHLLAGVSLDVCALTTVYCSFQLLSHDTEGDERGERRRASEPGSPSSHEHHALYAGDASGPRMTLFKHGSMPSSDEPPRRFAVPSTTFGFASNVGAGFQSSGKAPAQSKQLPRPASPARNQRGRSPGKPSPRKARHPSNSHRRLTSATLLNSHLCALGNVSLEACPPGSHQKAGDRGRCARDGGRLGHLDRGRWRSHRFDRRISTRKRLNVRQRRFPP